MSSIVISGDSSGSITLAAPSVAGTNTITLPAASGVCMVSGNMPAFSVYLSTNQTVSSNTATKVAFDTKEFDTNTNFNTSTYRFTPTVAGYYQINAYLYNGSGASISPFISQIYKNGSVYMTGTRIDAISNYASLATCIVYMNGSTDYLEMYGYTSGTVFASGNANYACRFSGSMIRGA